MPMLTVRNLDPEVHARLRERAALHGRSMEAEARAVLAESVLGDAEPVNLAAAVRKHFAEAHVELDLPDRTALQRPIELAE
ncbi:FitA-like ribbon-helix-helix domain-containing protein [Cryobacterium tepidiphilum]|uniref:Antitoxin FitA-like ribbon-helix-helix domain-containing protein n=1 Tax=Cryobacterium tepidiphilum TaxID=2486026 RepID=A0A3M8LIB7_9MICO|nr:hypothetical protein [Cryobacterium tepidiphilum]RNE64238.1 hypothetical protein EEJ31_04895 [Cryobacterium tepidiphilum]